MVYSKLRGGFMKDISRTLLASGFVLFALLSLLTAIRSSDGTRSVLMRDEGKVSELGLRFALER